MPTNPVPPVRSTPWGGIAIPPSFHTASETARPVQGHRTRARRNVKSAGYAAAYRSQVAAAPSTVAQLRRRARGVDDVGEYGRRQHPFGLRLGAGPGEELLHLAQRELGLLVPEAVVLPGELHEACVGHVLGEPAPVADVD